MKVVIKIEKLEELAEVINSIEGDFIIRLEWEDDCIDKQ
mgnify:FL=1